MVVEDSPAYLYLIQRAFRLRAEGTIWDLIVAKDGQEAINILFETDVHGAPPDLILLDWKLPGLSGSDVLLRLKTHKDMRKIPALVFSTSGEDEDVHSAYRAHANGYIKKPSDADALDTVVESIEQFWTAVATLAVVTRQARSFTTPETDESVRASPD